jgi:hypothetical protein
VGFEWGEAKNRAKLSKHRVSFLTPAFGFSVRATGAREKHSMKKRTTYTEEPIKIGRQVGTEILPGHGGSRQGSGRPVVGNKPVTLRLPPKLIEKVRREAKKAGRTMSELVAEKLRG